MDKSLLILGAGGHGRCIAEVAALSGEFSKIAFLDDTWKKESDKKTNIVGCMAHLAQFKHSFTHTIIGVGNNCVREKLHRQVLEHEMELASLVHPKAAISASAQLGIGTVVFAGVVISSGVRVGQSVIINCNSTVDHDGFIDDFSHLGVGVQLAGSCQIGQGAFIQAGSCGGFNAVAEPNSVFAPGSILKSLI